MNNGLLIVLGSLLVVEYGLLIKCTINSGKKLYNFTRTMIGSVFALVTFISLYYYHVDNKMNDSFLIIKTLSALAMIIFFFVPNRNKK